MENARPVSEFTPERFERYVAALLKEQGIGLEDFETERLERLSGDDGEYLLDAAARCTARGTTLKVLVECKRHEEPVHRDAVLLLNQKLQATAGQKGIIVSTSPFQRAAVEAAKAHGIALVQLRADASPSHVSPHRLWIRSVPPAFEMDYDAYLLTHGSRDRVQLNGLFRRKALAAHLFAGNGGADD